jgi:ceramide glucosyltransferase
LARAARHDVLVVSDGDIRVGAGYLRAVAAPFRETQVGAVTSLYTGISPRCLWSELEAINLSGDFMPAVLVARQLEGVRFALGATMAARRDCLKEIGGFEALADVAADDHYLGQRIAARGYRVELVDAAVQTMCSVRSLRACFEHHLRWGIMNRQSRPWGYLGYGITLGLPWMLLAALAAPTRLGAFIFVTAYLVLRAATVWTVGVRALRDPLLRRRWWLVPLWDAFAAVIWLASLFAKRVRWRGEEYEVRHGRLVSRTARAHNR